jgi:hypothetical protein
VPFEIPVGDTANIEVFLQLMCPIIIPRGFPLQIMIPRKSVVT